MRAVVLVGWLAAALVGRGDAWCLEDDKGPCAFNLKSKTGAAVPRKINFFDADDKVFGALQATPAAQDLAVFLGGEALANRCLHVTESSLGIGLGQREAKHTVDVESKREPAVLSLAGAPAAKGTCAALQLQGLGGKPSATLFFDSKSRVLGLAVGNALGGASELDVANAVFAVEGDAAPGSLKLAKSGALELRQVGDGPQRFPSLVFDRARGSSPTTPQIALKDDVIGKFLFRAHDGSQERPAAAISAMVHGQVRAGQVAGRVELAVADDKGTMRVQAQLLSGAFTMLGGADLRLESGGNVVLEEGELRVEKGTTELGGALAVAGPVALSKGLLVSGGDAVLEDVALVIKGKAGLSLDQGDVHLENGGVSCKAKVEAQGGLETAGSLDVKGPASVGGDFEVGGAKTKVGGTLEVANEATFKAGLRVSAGGTALAGDLVLENSNSKFRIEGGGKDAARTPFFEVDPTTKQATLDGNLVLSGGGLTCEQATIGAGGARVEGALRATAALDVGEDASFAGLVLVANDLESDGPESGALVVRGGVGIEKSLAVGNAIYLGAITLDHEENGPLVVDGAARIKGALEVTTGGFIVGAGAGAGADADAPLLRVSAEAGASVNGALNVTGEIATGAAVRAAELAVSGAATLDGPLVVAGSLRGEHVDASSLGVAGDAVFSAEAGQTTISGQSGLTTFGGAVSVFAAGASSDDAPVASLSGSGLSVQGGFVVNGGEEVARFENSLAVARDLSVEGGQIRLGPMHLHATKAAEDQGAQLQVGEALAIKQLGEMTQLALGADGALELGTSPSGATVRSQSGTMALTATDTVLELSTSGLELRQGDETVIRANATGVIVSGQEGLTAAMVTTRSLCATEGASCITFGEQEAEPSLSFLDSLLDLDAATKRASLDGRLHVVHHVETGRGVIIPPTTVKLEAGATPQVLDADVAGFIVLEAAGGGKREEAAVQLSRDNVQPGKQLHLHNKAGVDVAVALSSEDEAQPALLVAGSATTFVFDGQAWVVPGAQRLAEVHLDRVRSLEAVGDLHIGAGQLSAGSIASTAMADADAAESGGEASSRLASVDVQGVLGAVPRDVLSISQDGVVQIGTLGHTNVTGAMDMQSNELRQPQIVGGTIRGITELQVSANMHVAGSVAEASDVRLKRNVLPLDSAAALERVKQLDGVTYEPRSRPAGPVRGSATQLGLIAQQVEHIVPEVVTTNELDGMKAVQYARLVPLLLESIKALEARVAALEQQLEL